MVNGHRTPLDLPDWAESIGEDGRPVALLGGGGRLGLAVASQLARAGLPVRVVEHRVERAERAMNHLVEEGAHAVTALCADWRDPSSLDSALGGSRLVILAAGPEVPAPMVAAAALRCGAHYMDCQFSDLKKLKGLQAFTDRARESHLCFITDCGIRPGMPAILLRHAAAQLKDVSRAEVYLAMALGADPGIVSPRMIKDHLAIARRGLALSMSEGRWVKLNARYYPVAVFPEPIGRRVAYPVFLGELRSLKDWMPTLDRAGFYLCGFGSLVDYLAVPTAALLDGLRLSSLADTVLAKAFARSNRGGSAMELRMEVEGIKDGWPVAQTLAIRHEDPMVFSAACVTACVVQLFEAAQRQERFGLWQQGLFLDPARTLEWLECCDVTVTEESQPTGAMALPGE